MSTSLYDLSVDSFLRTLDAVTGFLAKGADHASAEGLDLNDLVESRIFEDMLPFRFQLISVMHHSAGSLRGIRAGESGPPPSLGDLDYPGLQKLITDAAAELRAADADEVNALAGKTIIFRLPKAELPFTAENFVMSFSLPNLHFHAATAYDLLRRAGVPLGKRDYLGAMKMGV